MKDLRITSYEVGQEDCLFIFIGFVFTYMYLHRILFYFS